MGFILLVGCLCAMVHQAMANNPALNAVGGISPAFPSSDDSLLRRAPNVVCFSSVVSELSPPTPSASALNSWAISSESALLDAGCTVTVPASLSKDYLSYWSVVSTWASDLESKAADVTTDCGYDSIYFTVSEVCSASRTIIFSGATATATADSTPTAEAKTTVLDGIHFAKETIPIGSSSSNGGSSGGSSSTANAASQNRGLAATVLVIATVLGIAIAL